VNVGGDPGHDDYGLPPVDIEIPNDARELDRDVHAYYRELKAQRRRLWARRMCAPLARDGMVLPLLAGCLAVTLLAGTLLTVFTAGPPQVARIPAGNQARPFHVQLAPKGARLLPDVTVLVGGHEQSLRQLPGAARLLALIPPGCPCDPDVRHLTSQAHRLAVTIYLVGTGGAAVVRLSRRVHVSLTQVVEDYRNRLPQAFRPAVLTAVLVKADGSVARVIPNPGHSPQLAADLRLLARASP
jgi:hypothetical protein